MARAQRTARPACFADKIQHWALAASAYEAVLAEWHFRRGLALEKMRAWTAAASAYEAALARNDGNAEWHFRLGLTLEKMENWAAAASAYEAAVARDDGKANWRLRLDLAREKTKSTLTSRLDDSGTAVLAVIERQLGLRQIPFRRTFVRLEDWLIADRSIRLAESIPRLDKLLPAFYEARRNGVTCRLPLSCCAIYEEKRVATLRSFYPSSGVTIKVVGSGQAQERVRKDVQGRTLVAESGKLHVPRILASGVESNSAFIVEELIVGRHPTPDMKENVRALIPEIWATYQALGFSLTEQLPIFTLEAVEDELKRVPIPPHMQHERQCRDELVRRLQKLPNPRERPLVAGFGHGDLSLGNIIVTSAGKWFLIDWECSGRMAVAWDLRKLITMVPSLLPEIAHLIRMELQRPGFGDAMAAEHQCLFALGGSIAFRSRKGRRIGSPVIATIKMFRPVREWLQALA